MIRNRILSLLVCAALLACLLAGCSTSSGTDGGEAASSSSSAASSESIPSSTTQANTGKLTPNLDESDNSIFSPASTQDAFEPCLGWGPGVSGCSLKSVIAADSLLSWAENGNLAMQTTDVIEDAYTEWYDSLSTDEQDSFADAWPLIKEDANALLTGMQLHVGHLSALMNPLTYVLINLAIVALLYVGSIEINVGGMASGDVIALVNYMNQILVELVKLANLIVQISKALACASRVQAVLDTEPGMAFPAALPDAVEASKADDAVRFDHVSLTYAGAGAPSLSDISFTAKRGQTIGVIGGTGSGKSSLINLIPRFYDATEGSVEILGRPVQAYPRDVLRGSVSVVMQKAQLFGGTIRSNLLWGNKNASDADLWAALETAQAAEFVKAKPLGLDEPVEQGGRNLSGGQKQRLTIARALVSKPDILILDDSASALDYATDAALRKALAALPGSLTVFIVSQRAASLQHADQILVLDDGKLVGLGKHADLLASCPVYEEIYASQFKKGDAQK